MSEYEVSYIASPGRPDSEARKAMRFEAAKSALAGLLANPSPKIVEIPFNDMAQCAVIMGDAMLRELDGETAPRTLTEAYIDELAESYARVVTKPVFDEYSFEGAFHRNEAALRRVIAWLREHYDITLNPKKQ